MLGLMKPDKEPGHPDVVERAHLREPGDTSHVMYRFEPPADLAGLVGRFWIPVWSVPPGRDAPQKVLQYPGVPARGHGRLRAILRRHVRAVDDDADRRRLGASA